MVYVQISQLMDTVVVSVCASAVSFLKKITFDLSLGFMTIIGENTVHQILKSGLSENRTLAGLQDVFMLLENTIHLRVDCARIHLFLWDGSGWFLG